MGQVSKEEGKETSILTKGKREAYSASQTQLGISKLNKSKASVRMLHCNTVALNPLLSL